MGLTSLLFSFQGRINRAKLWLAELICLVGGMLILRISLDAIADGLRGADPDRIARLFPIFFYAIAYPLFAVGLWTLAATTIKRLRDRDKSGWWIVPFMVLPILLPDAANRLGNPTVAFVLGLIALALSVWSFVELFCLRGTRGPNRFGPDPIDRTGSHPQAVSPGLA